MSDEARVRYSLLDPLGRSGRRGRRVEAFRTGPERRIGCITESARCSTVRLTTPRPADAFKVIGVPFWPSFELAAG
jgi:hypothetical protein